MLSKSAFLFLHMTCLFFLFAILQHPTSVSGARAQSPVHPGSSESDTEAVDTIPESTRAFWMRRAIASLSELGSPCPFAAFGTVIVNHTVSEEGELVCIGANAVMKDGNPTLHGKSLSVPPREVTGAPSSSSRAKGRS
jgi:hypothetical protein